MKKPFWFAGCLAAVSVGVSARAAEFILQPVRASGAHAIVGTEIRLEGGGQRVFLEIRIRDFAPHLLKAWQATLDSAGYSSGTAGTFGPVVQPCPSADSAGNTFCQTAFGDAGLGGSNCIDNYWFPNDFLQCEAAWINQSRLDWVFYGRGSIAEPDISSLGYRWGGAIYSGEAASDEGATYYGGGLAIGVPTDAVGTFTIGFIPDEGYSFIYDENGYVNDPLLLTPAKITVLCINNAQCDDGNVCSDDHCDPETHECVNTLLPGNSSAACNTRNC